MDKPIVNSPEWRQKIKDSKAYYKEIQDLGVIEACKQGVIKKVGISFSGGKDSVATLLWAKENLSDIPGLDIRGYYVFTPLENQHLKEYCYYISRETGISIDIVEHGDDVIDSICEEFYQKSEKYGPPFLIRLCESIVKHPLYKIINDACDINLIGIRWKESVARSSVSKLFRESFQIYYHPVITYSKYDVFEAIKKHKLKLFYGYKYSDRIGCSICPLGVAKKNSKEVYYIANMHESIKWDFYDKWFGAMAKFKYDRSGKNFVERHTNMVSNFRRIKKLISLEKKFDLKEYDVPVHGWWYPEEKN